ncbi:hypothetical protein J2T09_004927, partial [Neorhizobium huautlense]|nr:hypothetical protein [Neorhizobium huautlense]
RRKFFVLADIAMNAKRGGKTAPISPMALEAVIGDGKSVIGVIASVGGFLGLGSSYVVIDPASMAIADDNGTWKAYVDTNKEALTAAPKFDYDKMNK